jgi:hypothetical protein
VIGVVECGEVWLLCSIGWLLVLMLFDVSMERSQVRMQFLIYYHSMGEVSKSDKRKLGAEFEYSQHTGFGRFVQRGDFAYSMVILLTLKSLFGGQLIDEKAKAW